MADSDSAENYQPSMAAPPDGTTPLPLLISATYDYLANSPLVSQIAFSTDQTLKMTTSKQYDFLDRLTRIASVLALGGSLASAHAYQYDLLDQRRVRTDADGSFWSYVYDDSGQVTSGKRSWSDSKPVAGQQFEYTFDQIGNRRESKAGGNAFGAGLLTTDYTVNTLNQLLCRSGPGALYVLGEATNASASVLVNDQIPDRHGQYYAAQVPVNNSTDPVWASLTNIALVPTANGGELVTKVIGNIAVPPRQSCYQYDADGNLIADDRWTYTWDAENRLIAMESLGPAPVGSQRRLTFEYDWQGRRVRLGDSASVMNVWTITRSNSFLYDGWNLLAEFNATNNTLIRSYRSGRLESVGTRLPKWYD